MSEWGREVEAEGRRPYIYIRMYTNPPIPSIGSCFLTSILIAMRVLTGLPIGLAHGATAALGAGLLAWWLARCWRAELILWARSLLLFFANSAGAASIAIPAADCRFLLEEVGNPEHSFPFPVPLLA